MENITEAVHLSPHNSLSPSHPTNKQRPRRILIRTCTHRIDTNTTTASAARVHDTQLVDPAVLIHLALGTVAGSRARDAETAATTDGAAGTSVTTWNIDATG